MSISSDWEISNNFVDKLDYLLFSVSNIPGYWFSEFGCVFLSTVDWLHAENVMKELTCKSCSSCRQVTHSGQCALWIMWIWCGFFFLPRDDSEQVESFGW